MRKICTSHLFSSKRSQSFYPIREEEVSRMVKMLRNRAAASADFNVVNMTKTVMTVSSSIIYRTAFGKRYNDDGEDDAGYNNKMSQEIHWLLAETQASFASFFAKDYFPRMGRFFDSLCGSWTQLGKSFNGYVILMAHSASEVQNFSESCTPEILAPYLDGIVGKLLVLLQNGNQMVQEGALTALASIADISQEHFQKYYDAVMPYLKAILMNATDKTKRTLRARSMECISLIGMAVGKDKFRDECCDASSSSLCPA